MKAVCAALNLVAFRARAALGSNICSVVLVSQADDDPSSKEAGNSSESDMAAELAYHRSHTRGRIDGVNTFPW